MTRIIYLHGFNSSPASGKANALRSFLAARGLADCYHCPMLSHWPDQAIVQIDELVTSVSAPVTLVGSSLGGYYATCIAQRHGLKAVLVNPAILPHAGLESYLGPQRNLYTGHEYELTREHLRQWNAMHVDHITPSRYLLMLETADELLDYRIAMERYKGAQQIVVNGGDHTFRSFDVYLPELLRFAGFDLPAA